MLSHSLQATMGDGKLRELLKNRKFPTNICTEREEIGFKNNDLKIMEEGITGSHLGLKW